MNRRNPNSLTTRELAFRAEPVVGGGRTVEAVVCTDQPIEVWSWSRGEIILEALPVGAATLPEQCPLLVDHDRAVPSMIGSAAGFRRNGGELLAQLSFATGSQAADSVWPLVEGRHLRAISVGYRVSGYREIQPGQSATVAGKTYTAPAGRSLFVAEKWELKEISCVPIGADPAALIRSESTFSQRKKAMSTLDVLGSQTRSMRWPEYLAAGMKRRGERVPENDLDVGRAALSSVAGVGDLVGVANVTILGGYRTAPDSTQGWVRVVDLPNFLQQEIAAVNVSPRLEPIARGGVAPAIGFGHAIVQNWRLARFGAQFAIDDRDLIDGRAIGVFATAMEEVGRAARRLVADLVYATLLGNAAMADGTPIFHTDRSNYVTAALADTALDAALAAVGNQVGADEEGDPTHLGLSARYLCLPPDLFGLGKRLVRSMATGEGDLIVRSESRLGAAGVVDPRNDTIVEGSATNWLLTCPSDQAPGVVIGALGGSVEPIIRHYSLKNGEFGVGFDAKLDLACTVVDPKPLFFSTGAA